MLLCTGIFLGTSTYAWFTANKTVTVSPIDVNVEAKSGLQISVDGSHWKSIVSNEDLTGADATYAAAKNQIPGIIEPVSTAGIVNANGLLDMYLGEVTSNDAGDYILSSTKSVEEHAATTGSFVAFDLFLKTEQAAQIYLTTNSKVVYKDEADTGIKNATRVAFINLGNTNSDDTLANVQNLNGGAASPVIIWEPNYDTHTSYGVIHAEQTYGITTLTVGAGNAIVPYDGVKAEFDTAANVTVGNANATKFPANFQTVTPTISTVDGYSTYQELINLSAGITKIRVYMWIEGQDVDCENNASGGNIEFNLQMSTNSSADAS